VDKVLAVATSAIREAANGEDFLEVVGRETGIWPRAISGDEEARLIYLAALHSIHLEGKRALVLDIGGGSVELALGAGSRLDHTISEKLGVLRLAERFAKTDPLSAKEESSIVTHVEATLEEEASRLRRAGFDCLVGTSGTILTLGAIARLIETSAPAETFHHVTVKAETLREVRRKLVASDLKERLKVPGMDARRADVIAVGALILDTILDLLGARELMLCDWSLREGILLDYIQRHPLSLARAEAYPDVRRRSVVALAERCDYDETHARHAAALSLSLFDQTRQRHGLGDAERSLLEYAALLHDIGHHISYPGHHKHSYYLIKNGDLRGFDPLEIEMLACVARYHRRGVPRKSHEGYGALPKTGRRAVRVLAGLLRIADALDRGHRQVVRALTARDRGGALRVQCEAAGDCELEMWGVPRRAELLEEELGCFIRVEARAVGALEPVGDDEVRPRARRA
jgi:exopolyphosphatase/guanosine-5'-triphosphate,3'-diphosphate pyrophosphatase